MSAEKEASSLREELASAKTEIQRLDGALKKQAEDMKAVVSASPGAERESVLAQQLTEASEKANELEKAVSELQEAERSAQKQRGEAEAEAERKSASRDAAEKEATSLRQELGLKQAEIVRLEDAVAKAGEELKALLAADGSEREKVLDYAQEARETATAMSWSNCRMTIMSAHWCSR